MNRKKMEKEHAQLKERLRELTDFINSEEYYKQSEAEKQLIAAQRYGGVYQCTVNQAVGERQRKRFIFAVAAGAYYEHDVCTELWQSGAGGAKDTREGGRDRRTDGLEAVFFLLLQRHRRRTADRREEAGDVADVPDELVAVGEGIVGIPVGIFGDE